jgi:hypothetical protein
MQYIYREREKEWTDTQIDGERDGIGEAQSDKE